MMWIIAIIFAIMSVIFLCGKGGFLIAGYNTANKEEKAKYDEKKLCRVMGIGTLLMTLSIVLGIILEDYESYLIIGGTVIVTIVVLVGNSFYAKKDDYDFIPKKENEKKPWYKDYRTYSFIFTGIILVVVAFMMFTGSVSIKFENNQIIADASMTQATTIDYADIKSVEYKENIDLGKRTWGVGSAKLVAGNFENDQLGSYKLYAYTTCKRYVVISTQNGYVVINAENEKQTKDLYKKVQDIVLKKG